MKKIENYKGRKMYAIAQSERNYIIGIRDTIQEAVNELDHNWPILVELTVTRVFTRERDLKEIEIEDIN